MTDVILEIFRALIVGGIFIYLWIVGRKEGIHQQEGWLYILVGFATILFGMLIDITDNFPNLNRYIIIGDTEYQAILEKIFGYLLGFFLLAIGFWKWMPTVIMLKETQRELNKSHTLLELKVKERTASLESENYDRKQLEEELRENEKRLETLLYSIPVGIMILDSETHEIVSANPKAALMIDAPVEQFIGSQCHNFICPSEKGKCPISDLGQSVDNSECELLNANGESVPILKTVIPVNIDDRELFIECFVDITDRKKAEEELGQHEKLQGVIEMAGGVCHELNQPLQAIAGYSEILMMDIEVDNPLYDNIKSIKQQIVRMGDITEKLMTITRYETIDYLNGKIVDIDKATK